MSKQWDLRVKSPMLRHGFSDVQSPFWLQNMTSSGLRLVFLVSLIVISIFNAWGQGTEFDNIELDPTQIRPDMFMTIESISATTQKIEITVLREGYSKELLRQQCLMIGKMTGQPVDIVEIVATNLGTEQALGLGRAVVVTGGIYGPREGEIQFESLIHPFLGAEEPNTIDSVMITLNGFPVTNSTMRTINQGPVRGAATLDEAVGVLEYHFVLLSQEPDKIKIPSLVEEEIVEKPQNVKKTLFNPWLIPLFTLGIVGVGALVYFALLRPSRPKSKNPTRSN